MKRLFPLMLIASLSLGSHAETIQFPEALRAEYRRPERVPDPDDNPYSRAKYELGRALFFEPRLSASGITSCASCHNPSLSWGDGLAHGVGFQHQELGRKTPTLLNLAWDELYFWDGRADSLEDQALKPIESNAEMHMPLAELVKRLDTPSYRKMFQAAFPGRADPLAPETVAQALAVFERRIVSPQAPFDRWVAGDEKAVTLSAKRGFLLFVGKANCTVCHAGWRFSDGGFHDIGLSGTDPGRGKFLRLPAMAHAFKTPGLRDIARRYPYMHDGSLPSLEAVLAHYDGGFMARPSLDDQMRPLRLSSAERSDLIEFLGSLSSDDVEPLEPNLPR